jgi:hypothetical protein
MSDAELTEYQSGLLEIVQRRIPATAQEVATALGLLSGELEKVRQALDEAEDEALDKSEEHGRAYDKEFLSAGFFPNDPTRRVTERVREAVAREQTWELRLGMELAKLKVRKLKRQVDILDRRIFVGQSIAKTIRAEGQNIGYSQWT